MPVGAREPEAYLHSDFAPQEHSVFTRSSEVYHRLQMAAAEAALTPSSIVMQTFVVNL